MVDSDEQGAPEQAPWKSEKSPCVYCGRRVDRDARRCDHCRKSFSPAVRQASRQVVGQWFHLDPRNPSGRGVSFETLIKMIEKGRLEPDSVVRGPTTHQDWMYAAETPRLSKYFGICPHCFAEVSPEQTYCSSCQLNMNERPAGVRPGIPEDLVKQPYHQKMYELEEHLAERSEPTEEALPDEAPPEAAPTPPMPREPVGAGAISRERTSVSPARGRRPKIWVVLLLTWATIIPLFLVFTLVSLPEGCTIARRAQSGYRNWLGMGEETPAPPPTKGTGEEEGELEPWVAEQQRQAARLAEAGQYRQAAQVYERIERRTRRDYGGMIVDLNRRYRKRELARLKEKLDRAALLADERDYDQALEVLASISGEGRRLLREGPEIDVSRAETDIRRQKEAYLAAVAAREERFEAAREKAARLRREGHLEDALYVLRDMKDRFPDSMLARADVDGAIADIQAEIAARPPETGDNGEETANGGSPGDNGETVAQETDGSRIAARCEELKAEADRLQTEEKYREALAKLEAIMKYEEKYWPEGIKEKARTLKKRIEAMDFFGMD